MTTVTTTATTLARLPMPIGYFRLILRAFGTTAARRAAILAGTGITEAALRDATTEVALSQQLREIANVEALVGADWPLVAELRAVQVHGAIGIAALAAPDVAAAMATLERLAAVHAPFAQMRLHRRAGQLILDFGVEATLEAAQWRPLVEVGLLGIHAILAALLGRPPAEARFAFACPPPPHHAALAAILGESLTYDAAVSMVEIPVAWLGIASPFADPIMFAHSTRELQAALRRLKAPGPLRGRVENLLAAMPDGRIDAPQVARQLGVSPRTLARRLGEADTSFRTLLDSELRQRARALLDAGGLGHAEIGARLGYDDPTSFSRACRRWFRSR
ncbi:MAG: AraC family transcriptional regulator ligand-binding domain-containing protein [Polymorphobacter sp.]